jgi:hypothetical protein
MKVTVTFFSEKEKSFITSKEQHKFNGVHQDIFDKVIKMFKRIKNLSFRQNLWLLILMQTISFG